MDKALAARRLSAALSTQVAPEDVEHVSDDIVVLKDGRAFALVAGNGAYVGEGRWFKNGKPWTGAQARSLSDTAQATA